MADHKFTKFVSSLLIKDVMSGAINFGSTALRVGKDG